jgi:hypothetical protein
MKAIKSIMGNMDYKLLAKQTKLNLIRKNREQNQFYGPLGSVGIGEFEFLHSLKLIERYGEDFYLWKDQQSQQEWFKLKKMTLSRYFQGVEYKTNDRDVILSLKNKRQIFIQRDYSTTWEKIRKIEITPEDEILINQFIKFEELIKEQK